MTPDRTIRFGGLLVLILLIGASYYVADATTQSPDGVVLKTIRINTASQLGWGDESGMKDRMTVFLPAGTELRELDRNAGDEVRVEQTPALLDLIETEAPDSIHAWADRVWYFRDVSLDGGRDSRPTYHLSNWVKDSEWTVETLSRDVQLLARFDTTVVTPALIEQLVEDVDDGVVSLRAQVLAWDGEPRPRWDHGDARIDDRGIAVPFRGSLDSVGAIRFESHGALAATNLVFERSESERPIPENPDPPAITRTGALGVLAVVLGYAGLFFIGWHVRATKREALAQLTEIKHEQQRSPTKVNFEPFTRGLAALVEKVQEVDVKVETVTEPLRQLIQSRQSEESEIRDELQALKADIGQLSAQVGALTAQLSELKVALEGSPEPSLGNGRGVRGSVGDEGPFATSGAEPAPALPDSTGEPAPASEPVIGTGSPESDGSAHRVQPAEGAGDPQPDLPSHDLSGGPVTRPQWFRSLIASVEDIDKQASNNEKAEIPEVLALLKELEREGPRADEDLFCATTKVLALLWNPIDDPEKNIARLKGIAHEKLWEIRSDDTSLQSIQRAELEERERQIVGTYYKRKPPNIEGPGQVRADRVTLSPLVVLRSKEYPAVYGRCYQPEQEDFDNHGWRG